MNLDRLESALQLSEDLRAQVQRLLRVTCRERYLSATRLAVLLGVHYQTVAQWQVSARTKQDRSQAAVRMSARSCIAAIRVFPELRAVGAEACGIHAPSLSGEFQLRQTYGLNHKWWQKAQEIFRSRMLLLGDAFPLVPRDAAQAFAWNINPQGTPGKWAQTIRTVLGHGLEPIRDVSVLVERLGVPVVAVGKEHLNLRRPTLATDLSGDPSLRPLAAMIVCRGDRDCAKERHGLLVELGFLLLRGNEKKEAERAAAVAFADEMLVPWKGIEQWLVVERAVWPREIAVLAEYYGAPPIACRRQCVRYRRRFGRPDHQRNQPELEATAGQDPQNAPWAETSEGGKVEVSYLGFLCDRLVARSGGPEPAPTLREPRLRLLPELAGLSAIGDPEPISTTAPPKSTDPRPG